MDERSVAHTARTVPTQNHDEAYEQRRSCFYCLEGWVFLGSLDHDGEEIVEVIRCRRCGGTGRIHAGDEYL